MHRFRTLAMTLLLATAALALTPNASAVVCDEIETVDDVQECRTNVEDAVQRLVGTVLYEVCHRVDPQRCP